MTIELRAGVARADITPPLGIGHAGWGAQLHQRAAGVALPLWMTALAIADDESTCVIIDIDCMYLFETEAAAVRQRVAEMTGLPEAHIRISYTHTHSGPVSGATWRAWMTEGADLIEAYDARLCDEAAGVAWAAIRAMQPVRIGTATGEAAIAVNRRYARPNDGVVVVGRNPEGPVDHQVPVIRFDTLEGDPLAAIVGYACHPITVGPDNDLITPDYPGVVKRVVEQATGATCLFLQGAAGDIGPIRGVARNGINEYTRLGTILGLEASKVWWELELPARIDTYRGTVESGAPLADYEETLMTCPDRSLKVLTRVVSLPTRRFGDPDAYDAEFAHLLAELEPLRTSGSAEAIRNKTMLAKRAGMRAGLARKLDGRDTWEVELHAIALGHDIALLGMAAEPFSEIGTAIRTDSPFPQTFVSGYTGVGWAYLPTADAYPLGGYEVEVTPFAPEAAELMIDACRDMLGALYDEVTR